MSTRADERKARKQAQKERRQRAHPERQIQSLKARGLPAHELVWAGRPRG